MAVAIIYSTFAANTADLAGAGCFCHGARRPLFQVERVSCTTKGARQRLIYQHLDHWCNSVAYTRVSGTGEVSMGPLCDLARLRRVFGLLFMC